jgi:hypothetical protein
LYNNQPLSYVLCKTPAFTNKSVEDFSTSESNVHPKVQTNPTSDNKVFSSIITIHDEVIKPP